MRSKKIKTQKRSNQQIKEHYLLEKNLADILRHSGREERKNLYTATYEKLFQSLPHHPQLTRKFDADEQEMHVASQIQFIKPLLKPEFIYLEIGPGDCSLTFKVASYVKKAIAVDITEMITQKLQRPPNFRFIITDGREIPLPLSSINLAYSNHLMEHLHPDDAFEQIINIYDTLATGGKYFCITPHRFNGPHDISKYFDDVATGFHLKEYTILELERIFRKVGFSKVKVVYLIKERLIQIPSSLIKIIEVLLNCLTPPLRRKIASWRIFKFLLGIKLIAIK